MRLAKCTAVVLAIAVIVAAALWLIAFTVAHMPPVILGALFAVAVAAWLAQEWIRADEEDDRIERQERGEDLLK